MAEGKCNVPGAHIMTLGEAEQIASTYNPMEVRPVAVGGGLMFDVKESDMVVSSLADKHVIWRHNLKNTRSWLGPLCSIRCSADGGWYSLQWYDSITDCKHFVVYDTRTGDSVHDGVLRNSIYSILELGPLSKRSFRCDGDTLYFREADPCTTTTCKLPPSCKNPVAAKFSNDVRRLRLLVDITVQGEAATTERSAVLTYDACSATLLDINVFAFEHGSPPTLLSYSVLRTCLHLKWVYLQLRS